MVLVDHLMDRTFAQRRNHILGSAPTIADILHKYQFLEEPKEVHYVLYISIIIIALQNHCSC